MTAQARPGWQIRLKRVAFRTGQGGTLKWPNLLWGLSPSNLGRAKFSRRCYFTLSAEKLLECIIRRYYQRGTNSTCNSNTFGVST